MNPIISALLSIKPGAPISALELLHRIHAEDSFSIEQLLAFGPELEAALVQAEEFSAASKGIVHRCAQLLPVPVSQPLPGF